MVSQTMPSLVFFTNEITNDKHVGQEDQHGQNKFPLTKGLVCKED